MAKKDKKSNKKKKKNNKKDFNSFMHNLSIKFLLPMLVAFTGAILTGLLYGNATLIFDGSTVPGVHIDLFITCVVFGGFFIGIIMNYLKSIPVKKNITI